MFDEALARTETANFVLLMPPVLDALHEDFDLGRGRSLAGARGPPHQSAEERRWVMRGSSARLGSPSNHRAELGKRRQQEAGRISFGVGL